MDIKNVNVPRTSQHGLRSTKNKMTNTFSQSNNECVKKEKNPNPQVSAAFSHMSYWPSIKEEGDRAPSLPFSGMWNYLDTND